MKKRGNILLFISLCLICSFAIRVYFVNRDVSKPPMKEYKKGEIVTFDEEYSVDNRKISKGYTIQILDSEILSVEDFREKYNLSEGDLEGQYNFTNTYYVVKAKFTNVNNQEGEEQGISLLSLPLVGKNYMVVFNAIAYPHLNPTMPIGGGFSLRPGTDMTVYLTYAIIAGNAPDIGELRKDPPQLQIAEYPIRKMLDIK